MTDTDKERIARLAATNPRVSLDDVGEGLELVRKLREMGVEPSGYNLCSPYGPSVAHSAQEGVWHDADS